MIRKTAALMALVLAAGAVLALSGCGRRGLIRVNGEKVSKEEFYTRLERVPVQTAQGTPKPAGRYVIEQIISEKIIQQLAKEKGVAPTEEQINRKIEFVKKQSGGDLNRVLAVRGMTPEDLKQQVALEQAFINLFTRGVKVSDAEIKAEYDKALKIEQSGLKRPEQVMLALIVTKDKAKIDKAYSMLKGGQEFSAVAGAMSVMPNAKQSGGMVGWVSRTDTRIPPQAIKALFALPIGGYTQPMKFQDDYVILKAEKKRPPKVTKLEEVKDVIRDQIAMMKASKNNTLQKDIMAFTKKSDIVVNAERYKDIVEEIKKQATLPAVPAGTTGTATVPGQ